MPLETIQDLLLERLRDLFTVRDQVARALPPLIRYVTAPALHGVLSDDFVHTRTQLARLVQVFDTLGTPCGGRRGPSAMGFLADANQLVRRGRPGSRLDEAIGLGALLVSHQAVTGYRGAMAYAGVLRLGPVAALLTQSLEEERRTSMALARFVEGAPQSFDLVRNPL